MEFQKKLQKRAGESETAGMPSLRPGKCAENIFQALAFAL
jgi:hypothetical protein